MIHVSRRLTKLLTNRDIRRVDNRLDKALAIIQNCRNVLTFRYTLADARKTSQFKRIVTYSVEP